MKNLTKKTWFKKARLTLRIITGVLFLAFATIFWPTQFGGSTGLVIVAGKSMEPTYSTGDLLITRMKEPQIGDVLVYKVKEGEMGSGMSVVHRVTGGSKEEGWITRGDNNPSDDLWRPKGEEISGVVTHHYAKAGNVIFYAKSPLVIAFLGSLVVCSILWPESKGEEKENSVEGERDPAA